MLSGVLSESALRGIAVRRRLPRELYAGASSTVALEIALSETLERRLLDLEVRAIEFMWRQEEELARISDEELTPRGWKAALAAGPTVDA